MCYPRGLAGCDSLSFDEVVNHLFVANHRCSCNPGLRSARKASQRSPGATTFRRLRGFRNCGYEYQKCYKKSFVGWSDNACAQIADAGQSIFDVVNEGQLTVERSIGVETKNCPHRRIFFATEIRLNERAADVPQCHRSMAANNPRSNKWRHAVQ